MITYPFIVDNVIVSGEVTKRLCGQMVDKSMWFVITPLPDDQYSITFKVENREVIHKLIK